MSSLVRVAFEALQAPSTSPGLKSVACATLLSALEQEIDVPTGTQFLVWHHLVATGATGSHHHHLIDPAVSRNALRVLADGDSGEAAKDLALAVLHGPNAGEIRNAGIESLVEQVLDERRVRRVTWLIEQVHELRGLEPDFIRGLRDRLATSVDANVRVGAVELGVTDRPMRAAGDRPSGSSRDRPSGSSQDRSSGSTRLRPNPR